MNRLLAQVPLGNIDAIGPLGNFDKGQGETFSDGLITFEGFISNIIGLLTVLAGLWFFYQIILSGLQWIGAGGDKQVISTAQKRLTFAVLGLLIVVASYALLGVVSAFLGLNIFNLAITLSTIHPI